ncbi:SIR2 family protein [Deinococcus sp. HMF7604]|uniref:SIR2 family protein n=1 Tax=Deinococcus betulae TaxID=2873312 RepID=UPI001CCA5866|nr:SIR2 family protein [Deinococcus betulae]MBZ9751758.1 SIR2 family protein [Deinococcus betulae]
MNLDQFIHAYQGRKEALKSLLVQGQPLLFVGAGVGANLYPVWTKLIRELISEAEITLTKEQSQLSDPEKAWIVKQSNRLAYKKVVRRHFSKRQNTDERVLTPLERFNFRGIITTNYDDALSRRFRHYGFETVTTNQLHLRLLSEAQRYIFHIHGRIIEDEPEEADLDIVLAQDEYAKYYLDSDVIPDFLKTAIGQYAMVFIGVSFSDKHVVDVLKKYIAQERSLDASGDSPIRYALMPIELEKHDKLKKRILDFDYIEEKEEELERLGIIPVWFQRGDNFRGLSDLLETWAESLKVQNKGIRETSPEKP